MISTEEELLFSSPAWRRVQDPVQADLLGCRPEGRLALGMRGFCWGKCVLMELRRGTSTEGSLPFP